MIAKPTAGLRYTLNHAAICLPLHAFFGLRSTMGRKGEILASLLEGAETGDPMLRVGFFEFTSFTQ